MNVYNYFFTLFYDAISDCLVEESYPPALRIRRNRGNYSLATEEQEVAEATVLQGHLNNDTVALGMPGHNMVREMATQLTLWS
jgi:hypothetical protein